MKKLFLTALFGISGLMMVSAQSFEGTIEFRKQTTTDTSNYVYYVKGDKVRIDEIGSHSKKVEGSYLVDLKTSSMKALSHERKTIIEMATGTPPAPNGKCEVKKTGATKTLQTVKCSEYIVKNPTDNTQITYWMASGKYDFFFKLLKILNRKDKSAVYIMQLTEVDGMFPFLSTQVNLETNKEVEKLEVTKVQKKTIDASMFEIPKDYKTYQK